MIKKKIITLFLVFVFLFSNLEVFAAKEGQYEVSIYKTSFSYPVIMYLLSELNIIDEDKDVITRGDCLEILINIKNLMNTNDPDDWEEDSLIRLMEMRKMPPIADWASLTLEEKNILYSAVANWIFFGEEVNGEIYANFDKPITYYEALSFFVRCYHNECLLLWQADRNEINQNWLDYAESIGILYGRVPEYVNRYAYTVCNIPQAEKEKIRHSSQEIIPSQEFYSFLWNMLTAPTYYDDFRKLSQGSMINMIIGIKMKKEGIL